MERLESLTPREKELLLYCIRGYNNKDIARELKITEHTVKTHFENIATKFNTHNRLQAVIYAIKSGIININDI